MEKVYSPGRISIGLSAAIFQYLEEEKNKSDTPDSIGPDQK